MTSPRTLPDYRVDPEGSAAPPPVEDACVRPARDGEIPIIDVNPLIANSPDQAAVAR
jgi:hypothetical protein